MRLKLIIRSSQLGFSLSDIKELFDTYERSSVDAASAAAFCDRLEHWRKVLERRRAEIELLLAEIDFFAGSAKARTR
jgi:DNA-binding transcriptional MerR regulator